MSDSNLVKPARKWIPPNAGKGRKKGSVNKATQDVKQAISIFAEGNVHKLEEWLETIANGDGDQVKPDPAKAADLFLKVIEYHIPKLARTEVDHKSTDGTMSPVDSGAAVLAALARKHKE